MKNTKLSDRASELIVSCKEEDMAEIKVEAVASLLGVNASYLSRKFKSDKDMTMNEFITGVKMWKSADALTNSKTLSTTKMAEKNGFARADYFVTLFKQQFGIHPKTFWQLKHRKRVKRNSTRGA
ncbi:MAG: helix-turn-helix transcriptional regulator [Candidatus Omnitrophota bacterium]